MTRNLAMQQTAVLIDAGYHSKIAKHFGNGKFFKHDVNQFAITLAKKQGLWCSAVYFYTAPPFQGVPPDPADAEKYHRYKSFVYNLRKIPNFTVREGRCQRINGEHLQKGVDTLLTMDLMTLGQNSEIETIVLVACDTDFVPILNHIRKACKKKVILYYFSDRVRGSPFSMSNHILTACDKHVLIELDDFQRSAIFKAKEK